MKCAEFFGTVCTYLEQKLLIKRQTKTQLDRNFLRLYKLVNLDNCVHVNSCLHPWSMVRTHILSMTVLSMTEKCCSKRWSLCDEQYPLPGNASPRAGRGAERERRVCLRLHRGAPANASPDLPLRHDQIRITPPQVC